MNIPSGLFSSMSPATVPLLAAALLLSASAGCRQQPPGGDGLRESMSLVIYSGRTEELIGETIERFRRETGIDVQVRYGGTSEMAALLLEEGDRSPADLFLAQDAGALGAVAPLLATLPEESLARVDPQFRSPDGAWVGISGRARVVAYNTDRLRENDLPASIHGFTDPRWKGRIAWAPTNGSFQAFITALRVMEGDQAARDWLEGVQANNPKDYPNNSTIIRAVGSGEVDVGLVNHYYLLQAVTELGERFPVRNYYLRRGDPGALVNVAGVGVLKTANNRQNALRYVEFLLSEPIQRYFAESTHEYPLARGVPADPHLPSLSEIEPPQIDLSDLADLERTLRLLRQTGILP